MNRDLVADFDLSSIRHLARYDEARQRVEMRLVSERDPQVPIPGAGTTCRLRSGETIWTESSCKFPTSHIRQSMETARFTQFDQCWPTSRVCWKNCGAFVPDPRPDSSLPLGDSVMRSQSAPVTNPKRLARSAWLLALFLVPDGEAFRPQPVYAREAMVVTAERYATEVGVDVLRGGGNAVDAAVAIGMALAVTEPNAGNLGGGGFMLLQLADGRSSFIDFRERAPSSAHRDMYLDSDGNATEDSLVGYKAAGVPGTVRGLALALGKYGTKKWAAMLEPAERLARQGFRVTWDLSESLRRSSRLKRFGESRRIFLNEGRYFSLGDTLKQEDLAATLARLMRHGADEFYTGETARLIAKNMAANDGTISAGELAAYKPVERRPVVGTYRRHTILSAPPPSSGGAGVIQILNIVEKFDLAATGSGSSATIHVVAEAMRRFFADRARFFGDTDFVEIPLQEMLSKKYAASRRASIQADRATPSAEVGKGEPTGYESDETTHYSVVDAAGNVVAVTYTLNGGYGSGVTAEGTGVLLNNEMDDFTAKPGSPNTYGLLQSENNAIAPGKRPLSAMSPTIVLRDGQPRLVVGAQGGPTIITSVTQVILNVLDLGMNVQQAVDFPRFHHQWMPDLLYLEPSGVSAETRDALEALGHQLNFGRALGHVEAIEIGPEVLMGAADSRSEGVAAGF